MQPPILMVYFVEILFSDTLDLYVFMYVYVFRLYRPMRLIPRYKHTHSEMLYSKQEVYMDHVRAVIYKISNLLKDFVANYLTSLLLVE